MVFQKIDYKKPYCIKNGENVFIDENNLKSLEVIIPSKRVINEFNQLIEPFFEIIKINEMEMEKLAKLKDVLLPKLMNGEIDISEVNCDLKITITSLTINAQNYLVEALI